ncbi:MAG: TonB-dependent receptor plug domain-containing protein, partial [Cyanobacteria bacterium P01_A01_bin.135]
MPDVTEPDADVPDADGNETPANVAPPETISPEAISPEVILPEAASPSAAPAAPDSTDTAAIATITDIAAIPIEDGLQLVLVTADPSLLQVFQAENAGTLVVDITNAQLALPTGESYRQENPVPSVTSISMTQATERDVRITVVGRETTAPVVYLERAPESLILDVVTEAIAENLSPPAEIEFGNRLRIIVTAEPLSRYRAPIASTGTRTDTDILDVPQGIQVITEEVLEDQGTSSLGDALRNVSGVSPGRASAGGRATTPIIRGFESDNILRNGLRDDTLRLSSGISNIEQIEILKGPASVLFGAGNLGGTVNLITEVPLQEPFYEAELTVGTDDLFQAFVDLTGPLQRAGDPAYRLNLAYEDRGSFSDFENGEFVFVAPSLDLIESDRTNLILDLEYIESRTRETAPSLPAISAIGLDENSLADTLLSGAAEIPEADIDAAGTLDIEANLGEPDISRTETSIIRAGYRF